MIIFTLDALANDSHRRHLIHPYEKKWVDEELYFGPEFKGQSGNHWFNKDGTIWNGKRDYPAYYEACDGDAPIHATIGALKMISHASAPIQIWSTLPESQRDAVYFWFDDQCVSINRIEIRMRPIGDDRPQEELFQRWLNQNCSDIIISETKQWVGHDIDMVFSSHGPTIDMFRRRGIFVFDCNQGK